MPGPCLVQLAYNIGVFRYGMIGFAKSSLVMIRMDTSFLRQLNGYWGLLSYPVQCELVRRRRVVWEGDVGEMDYLQT